MGEDIEGEKPAGLASRLSERLAKVKARTWGYLLLGVVVIFFLAQNSRPPVRIQFLFFPAFGLPFSLSAIIFVAIGFLLCYLWRRRLRA